MYACQVPRVRRADIADSLLDVAARVLSEEGRAAVTSRRLATEVGASTMAVYTHFGSMDELFAELLRRGFERFGSFLDEPSRTSDALADWATQGWAYRRFALHNAHLYRVMFGAGLSAGTGATSADSKAAAATFVSLLVRIQRCVEAGQLRVDDLRLAGEMVWASVHGAVSIELTGYFEAQGRDPEVAYGECLARLALGYGADPAGAGHSLRAARRRARYADAGA